MVVGLTGKYCAGKDVVANIFANRGWAVIDVDALGHEALVSHAEDVVAAFGPSVRGAAGTVDRRALGRIVFRDPIARARLEAIVHPSMKEEVRRILACTSGNVVVNAALLHRMGLSTLCHAVICVRAPLMLRLARALRRDRIHVGEAIARFSAQKGLCPKLNDRVVDTYTVRNRGSMHSLQRRVERVVAALRG
jgi:dephospho-CoA kinase